MHHQFIAFAVLFAMSPLTTADATQEKKKGLEGLKSQEQSIRTISPIFGQLLMISLPKGFSTTFENTKGAQYIREAVPVGENLNTWTQMITVTGNKDLAPTPNLTPHALANGIAAGFKSACPTSFNGTSLGAFKLGDHAASAAVISCGIANPSASLYSESALVIVIKGKHDYYTIQWAERSEPSRGPIKFDQEKWLSRLKRLMPIKLCSIIPGEPAPYPSCIGGA